MLVKDVTVKVKSPEDGCAYASANNIPHVRSIYRRLQVDGWDIRYVNNGKHDSKMFLFLVKPNQEKWVEVS